MKIVQVGSTGIAGKAVAAELGKRHELVTANRTTGDLRVNIEDTLSIGRLFSQIGEFDASTAGAVHFAPLSEFSQLVRLDNHSGRQISRPCRHLNFFPRKSWAAQA